MNVSAILAAAALAATALLGYSNAASAQATRTWVSGVGDDVNPCSRTAPCKTFAGAISKTAAGGEINCLDPAGFGAVTITKSMTIDCTGTLGSILASGTTGVIVNGANIDVTLRGLSINGGTPSVPGINGVRYMQGRSLLIDTVDIFNFGAATPNGSGVLVNNTSGVTDLTVVNSTISTNGTSAAAGIEINPTASGGANVTIARSIISKNVHGVRARAGGTTGAINVMVSDTVASGNSDNGFVIVGGNGPVKMVLDGVSSLRNGATGVRASNTNTTVIIGRSVVSGNATGLFSEVSAQILSFGNNHVSGNGTDGNPTGSATLK